MRDKLAHLMVAIEEAKRSPIIRRAQSWERVGALALDLLGVLVAEVEALKKEKSDG